MTLFVLQARDDLLAVRFAISPVWETQAAVQALADERALLSPALAAAGPGPCRPARPNAAAGRAAKPRLRAGLPDPAAADRQARSSGPAGRDPRDPPAHVARELERCRETVDDEQHRRQLTSLLTDPERARDQLAARLHHAWTSLVAPFWVRIRTLLDRDIDERSRTLARHGLRRALDELHPKIRWTRPGLLLADRTGRTVAVDERGVLLMPSAYLWPYVAAIIEEPWQPTIVYPATGIAELWQAPAAPPGTLGRLLGRTRALILAALDQPLSTTALAAATGLSPAGVSRHLLALRDAGLLTPPGTATRSATAGPNSDPRSWTHAADSTTTLRGQPCRSANERPRSFSDRRSPEAPDPQRTSDGMGHPAAPRPPARNKWLRFTGRRSAGTAKILAAEIEPPQNTANPWLRSNGTGQSDRARRSQVGMGGWLMGEQSLHYQVSSARGARLRVSRLFRQSAAGSP